MSNICLGYVNIAFAILLLLWMYFKREPLVILAVLFVYGSIHFAYTSIPFFYSLDSSSVINEFHITGSVFSAKLSGIAIFAISLITLFLLRNKDVKVNAILVFGVINIVFFLKLSLGFFLSDDYLSMANLIALCCFIGLILIAGQSVKINHYKLYENLYSFLVIIICIQTVAFAVAIYELYTLKAWATFVNSNGDIVYRASSIFFNPNIYGIWSVLVALLFSYFFHIERYSKIITSIVIIQASIAIFLAGSRSTLLLLLLALFLIPLLTVDKNFKRRSLPFLLVFFSTFGVSAIFKFLQNNFTYSYVGMDMIFILADRIIMTPVYLISYILGYSLPGEVLISIEGRTNGSLTDSGGSLTDSGWLTLLNDTGVLGFVLFLCFMSLLLYKSLRTYFIKLDITSAYGVVVILIFLLVGGVMRFQVFPVWWIFSVPIAVFLSYWQNAISNKNKVNQNDSV